MPIFSSFRFISNIISHENSLFSTILVLSFESHPSNFCKRFNCKREKSTSEFFKRDPASLNYTFQVRSPSKIYKVLLPELDPQVLVSHTTLLKNKTLQLLLTDKKENSKINMLKIYIL